jgi:hypothetical protein
MRRYQASAARRPGQSRNASHAGVLLGAVGHIRPRRPAVAADGDAPAPRSLREWARGQFATAAGFVKANLAAVEILLPIVAVVAGLVALALVNNVVS